MAVYWPAGKGGCLGTPNAEPYSHRRDLVEGLGSAEGLRPPEGTKSCHRKMAPGFIREDSVMHRPLAQEARVGGDLDGGRQIRKRAKTERSGTELPALNYQFGEGPRRLPSLISFSGQDFG